MTLNKNSSSIFSLKLIREEEESLTAWLCLSKKTLLELEQSMFDWIHPEEKSTADRLTFPKRKISYLLGRYSAKRALAEINPTSLKKIFVGEGVFNHPLLHGTVSKELQISIAHTKEVGAALIFNEAQPMAIDIESNDGEHSSTIESQLTPIEKDFLKHQWSSTFGINPYPWIWTAKEALGKVLKTGLTTPMSLFLIKELEVEDSFIKATYENFPQYKVLSFLWNEIIVSIVLPKKTKMILLEAH